MSDTILSSGAGTHEAAFRAYDKSLKSIGFSQDSVAGTTSGPNPALADWYRRAHEYWNAVQAGQEHFTSPQQEQQFVTWMQWAYQQLTGAAPAWDPQNQSQEQGPGDSYGGVPGAQGNLIHRETHTSLGFTGGVTRDVWSDQIEINLDNPALRVSVEKTQDERGGLEQEVIKILIQNPDTGAEDLILLHETDQAQILLRVPHRDQVQNHLESSGQLQIAKYFPATEGSQSSQQGELVSAKDNWYLYEAKGDEVLEFSPQAGGNDFNGDPSEEIFEVYGDARIIPQASDRVQINDGMPGDPSGMTVSLTHRDGSRDLFYLHRGSYLTLYAQPEAIQWGDGPMGVATRVPPEFQGRITLGDDPQGHGRGLNPHHPQDTAPDEVQEDTAHYHQSQTVDVHAYFGDEVSTHRIAAPGTVVIHGSSYADTMLVTYDESQQKWMIQVFKNGDRTQVETFVIQGGPETRVMVDALESNVEGNTDHVEFGTLPPQSSDGGYSGDFGDGYGLGEEDHDPSDLGGPDNTGFSIPTLRTLSLWLNDHGINGATESSLNRAAREVGLSEEELRYPTLPPSEKLIDFLRSIDPALQTYLKNTSGLQDDPSARAQARDRLMGLLSALFPEAELGPGSTEDSSPLMASDDLIINGEVYDIIDNDTGEIRFERKSAGTDV